VARIWRCRWSVSPGFAGISCCALASRPPRSRSRPWRASWSALAHVVRRAPAAPSSTPATRAPVLWRSRERHRRWGLWCRPRGGEVWEQVYDRLAELISEHRTTLIFVNTRRMAERVASQLSERLGEKLIAAHHGSMSKEHRLDAERRLQKGELKALVATASLELGIDIGEVNLVCQLGSPRSIAGFLQRVGRSGHAVAGTPKGRLFALSRDDLVECAALIESTNRGELDQLVIPERPLDVLAQQIVAEVGARECNEQDLFA